MGPGACRDGVDASNVGMVGYRIRILEPVEVSSGMEVRVYPDRSAAIDAVERIAMKLTMHGFPSYRISILEPNDTVVWTMTKTKDRTR